MRNRVFCFISFCVMWLVLHAQNDSLLHRSIDEVVVEDQHQPIVSHQLFGNTRWTMSGLRKLPSLTGSADPLRHLQLLPGVQVASEMSGGLSVQGCDNSHNYISIEGVPVYYPMHLLGFFSTFNTLHFENLSFEKNVSASTANRIGAFIDMQTADTIPASFGMDMEIGLMSSQAAARIPLGENMAMLLSGRYANINVLYNPLINPPTQNVHTQYRFHDLNLSWYYQLGEKDRLSLHYFEGADVAAFDVRYYQMFSQMFWTNRNTSLQWKHDMPRGYAKTVLYYTSYANRMFLSQSDAKANLESGIHTAGIKWHRFLPLDYMYLIFGSDFQRHSVQPQAPYVEGSYVMGQDASYSQDSKEGSLYVQAELPLSSTFDLTASLQSSFYENDFFAVHIDPQLKLRYQPSKQTLWQLSAGMYTQYLHQLGFSNNGLPTEFWYASDKDFLPQRALKISAGYQQDFLDSKYRLSTEIYYTQLYNQLEYRGSALSLMTEKYHLADNIINGRGANYGLELMLSKNAGPLHGWMSYTWSKAPRFFPNISEIECYPSVHHREHELKMLLNYECSPRWNISATWIYAGGTPYTAVESAVILQENLIVNYGKHNGARYPAYKRLDVSARYRLPDWKQGEQYLSFSMYNALFSKNPIAYQYRNMYKEEVYLFSTILPSISYYIHF